MSSDQKKPLLAEGAPASIVKSALPFYLVLLVFVGTANKVMLKAQADSMVNYGFFLTNFNSFFYIPVSFAVIFFKQYFTKDITPEMEAFPKKSFFVIGFLDMLQGYFIVFGASQVPGGVQQLLTQGLIPLTIFFSLLFLPPATERSSSQTRELDSLTGLSKLAKELEFNYQYNKSRLFHPGQYLGAVVIIVGIFLAMVPSLFGAKANDAVDASLFWSFFFFMSNVPTSISGVYKEIAFRQIEDMDVWYMNGWIALFQFFLGLPLAVLAPYLGGFPFSELSSNITNGAACLFKGEDNFVCGPDAPSNCRDDDCDGALLTVAIYECFNIAYNVIILKVVQLGSASLFYVASTIIVPLAFISFSLDLPSKYLDPQPFELWYIIGLIVIIGGLSAYRYFGTMLKERLKQLPEEEA